MGGEIYGGVDDMCVGIESGDFVVKVWEVRERGMDGASRAFREASEAFANGTLEMLKVLVVVMLLLLLWLMKLVNKGLNEVGDVVVVVWVMVVMMGGGTRRTERRFGGLSDGVFGLVKMYKGVFMVKDVVDWMMKNGKVLMEEEVVWLGVVMVCE